MAFRDKINSFLEGVGGLVLKGPSVGLLKDDLTIYRSLREVMAMGQNSVHFPYKQSLWVYACINAIADNMARVPFRLKKDAGDNKPAIVIEEGPLYELFQNPNPYMTQEDLIRATMIYLGLRGEAIWILDGRANVSEIPKAVWCFDPARFEPVFEQRAHVGWVYKKNTPQQVVFAMSEILFFRYFNPYDDLRGMPPVDAARASVDQDFMATQYNTAFFKNGASPGGFISVDGELDDDSYNRLVKSFESRHAGPEKAFKIAIVEGGGKFKEATVTQRDMQWIEGKKLTREEIMAAYKVNQVILGLYKDVKSYEGIKAAHKAFWEECLMPKVLYLESYLWSKFFSKIGVRRGKGRVWGEFDLATVGPLQVNYADQVDTAYKMWSMGWPINAINIRLNLGMQEVKWGNEWWVPGGFLPVTALLDYAINPPKPGKQPVNTPGPNGTNPPPKKPAPREEGEAADFVEIREIPMGNPREIILGISYEEQLLPLERTFRSKTKRFLFEQRKKVLAGIYARTPEQESRLCLDKGRETAKMDEALRQLYKEALGTGYSSFCVEQGLPSLSLAPESGSVSAYVGSKASFMSKNFMDMAENLIETLNLYINQNNPTNEEAATKAREIYNLLSGKCSLLSNKEAFIAYAYGRVLAIQRHGSEQHRRFLEPFMKSFLGNQRLEETHNGKSN